LLLDCWLGPWIIHSGRVPEGVAVVSAAVAGLRALGDDSDRRAALREYRTLANGQGPLAATAFATATALVEELKAD
jgi:hypothetical protein